ncbi:MAG: hypothetical protein ACRC4M_04960 [Mycoplasma sp.]
MLETINPYLDIVLRNSSTEDSFASTMKILVPTVYGICIAAAAIILINAILKFFSMKKDEKSNPADAKKTLLWSIFYSILLIAIPTLFSVIGVIIKVVGVVPEDNNEVIMYILRFFESFGTFGQ